MDTKGLIERLNRNPIIKERIELLLDIAENTSGEFEKADDAEFALVDGIRKMGHELLQSWATTQHSNKVSEAKNHPYLKCHVKKNFIGIQHSDKL